MTVSASRKPGGANCASFTNPGHRRSARIAEEHSLFEFFARAALLADLFHLLLHKRLKVAPRLNALLLRAEIGILLGQTSQEVADTPGVSMRKDLGGVGNVELQRMTQLAAFLISDSQVIHAGRVSLVTIR